jgi:hypothetical protein
VKSKNPGSATKAPHETSSPSPASSGTIELSSSATPPP